jgi:hypothetical protein
MGVGVGEIVGSGCELTVVTGVTGDVGEVKWTGFSSGTEKGEGMGLSALLQLVITRLNIKMRNTHFR